MQIPVLLWQKSSRPDNHLPVTGESLREALDALLAGEPPVGQQKPSIGCNIKWKKDTR